MNTENEGFGNGSCGYALTTTYIRPHQVHVTCSNCNLQHLLAIDDRRQISWDLHLVEHEDASFPPPREYICRYSRLQVGRRQLSNEVSFA